MSTIQVETTRRKRRWFQFSLRGLLLLILLLGALFGWLWTGYIEPYRAEQATVDKFMKLRGMVYWQAVGWPRWLDRLAGGKYVRRVVRVELSGSQVRNSDLSALKALRHLRELRLSETNVTNEGLVHLKGLSEFTVLELDHSQISEVPRDTLKNLEVLQLHFANVDISELDLSRLTKLKGLYLRGARITDGTLEQLQGLTDLERLDASGIQGSRPIPVTDVGLRHLKGLRKLRELYIYDTQITGAGVEDLKRALPEAHVMWQ